MKKVSAIITTHNRCDLLKKALDSVLNQTYKNIECIVVDDKSNDGTENYMNSVLENNKQVKYIRIQDEKVTGGNFARNLGIKNSTGEYIAFLDDDDEWFPEKIEKQVEILEEECEVGLVTCRRKIEYNNGEMYVEEKAIDRGICDYSKKIFYTYVGVISSILFRKNLLIEIGGLDENLKFWQDYELAIRMCQISKIAFIDECLLLYRENLKDKQRKTNQFEKWLQATEYVHNKFKKEIETLSKKEKNMVKLLVYNDAAIRCSYIKNRKEKRKYLLKSFKIKPSIKTIIKYIFLIDGYDLLKLKLKNNKI